MFFRVTEGPDSNYCKIEFPVIREETLYTNRPVLKDWSEDDIFDFFGPCGYDPLGKENIEPRGLSHAAISVKSLSTNCNIRTILDRFFVFPLVRQ